MGFSSRPHVGSVERSPHADRIPLPPSPQFPSQAAGDRASEVAKAGAQLSDSGRSSSQPGAIELTACNLGRVRRWRALQFRFRGKRQQHAKPSRAEQDFPGYFFLLVDFSLGKEKKIFFFFSALKRPILEGEDPVCGGWRWGALPGGIPQRNSSCKAPGLTVWSQVPP